MIKIEITDDYCADGEAWHLQVPLDTDKTEIMMAISTLFPTANTIMMYYVEEGVG